MSSLSYHARRGNIHLRVVAYQPLHEPMPEDHVRVVVQVVDRNRPIAEDPIHVENMPIHSLYQALDTSRAEGWDISNWETAH